MLMVLGSVPSSGWPALDTAVRTSGTVSKALRALCSTSAASSSEILAGRRRLTQMVPSLSSGKNSEPKREATPMEATKMPTAISITLPRLLSDQLSAGS